jgi:hypothetical protein
MNNNGTVVFVLCIVVTSWVSQRRMKNPISFVRKPLGQLPVKQFDTELALKLPDEGNLDIT